MGVEEVAQVGQPVAAGLHDAVEGVKHQFVGGLVKKELHAEVLAVLYFRSHAVLGDDDHHAVTVGITDRAGLFEIGDLGLSLSLFCHSEKAHGTAVFEIVLDVRVLGAENLHHQLVEGVVVGPAATDGKPGVATLHLPAQSDGLGLSAVSLLLGVVFDLEQQALLLESQDGVVHSSSLTDWMCFE